MRLDASSNTFSQCTQISLGNTHEYQNCDVRIETDGDNAVGLEVPEADCVSYFESLESCVWETAALVAEKDGTSIFDNDEFREIIKTSLRLGFLRASTPPSFSAWIKDESAKGGSLELHESLWEDEDERRKKVNDEDILHRPGFKFDRSKYRKWIGAKGLHTH